MWKDILILAGILLPIAGPAITITIGLSLKQRAHWLMLFLGPIISILPGYYFAAEIGNNANMFFVLLLAVPVIFLLFYYPGQAVYLLSRRFRAQ